MTVFVTVALVSWRSFDQMLCSDLFYFSLSKYCSKRFNFFAFYFQSTYESKRTLMYVQNDQLFLLHFFHFFSIFRLHAECVCACVNFIYTTYFLSFSTHLNITGRKKVVPFKMKRNKKSDEMHSFWRRLHIRRLNGSTTFISFFLLLFFFFHLWI